ncbi:MAG: ImmA/IrrE family metallo-endopeptidase [Acidobacteria bacterium]|nr:ImmA/IrrE family metallo-endopeptidase [Acidobacteriota bacterium]
MKVKRLSIEEIEASANTLLREYGEKFGVIASPPVPMDEIAECHLGLDIRIDNLLRLLRRTGVLGAIWIEGQRVMIDTSLDPSIDPSKEGRYRFTLAHEVGHWILHRLIYLALSKQSNLFAQDLEPSIVCRDGDSQPIEWQANTFAAYALMPRDMVRGAWERLRGNLEPYVAEDEIAALSAKRTAGNYLPNTSVARELAKEFHVSAQAMQIRLTELGLIKLHKGSTELFRKWDQVAVN